MCDLFFLIFYAKSNWFKLYWPNGLGVGFCYYTILEDEDKNGISTLSWWLTNGLCSYYFSFINK